MVPSKSFQAKAGARSHGCEFLSSQMGLFPVKQTQVNHWQFLADGLGRTWPAIWTRACRDSRTVPPCSRSETCCVTPTPEPKDQDGTLCNGNLSLRWKRWVVSHLSEQKDSELIMSRADLCSFIFLLTVSSSHSSVCQPRERWNFTVSMITKANI